MYKFAQFFSIEHTGHYTQMVWAETTLIGCGRSKVNADTLIFICNYGRAGNTLGMSVYKFGSSASDCGSLKPNSQYKSLCGESRIIPFPNPPFG